MMKSDSMTFLEIQKKSIEAIRSWGDAFKDWSDEDIADFYSYWSEQTYAAGWICQGEKKFYDYATTRPIETWRNR